MPNHASRRGTKSRNPGGHTVDTSSFRGTNHGGAESCATAVDIRGCLERLPKRLRLKALRVMRGERVTPFTAGELHILAPLLDGYHE